MIFQTYFPLYGCQKFHKNGSIQHKQNQHCENSLNSFNLIAISAASREVLEHPVTGTQENPCMHVLLSAVLPCAHYIPVQSRNPMNW